jgi:peptide subunit release factor RF-3
MAVKPFAPETFQKLNNQNLLKEKLNILTIAQLTE